ncbi:hypothetical protein SAMN05428948_1285 [Massilia sp. CF038]|nr:hypothetical protein SAMN05428948_1285 [Massilia sp. CF038]
MMEIANSDDGIYATLHPSSTQFEINMLTEYIAKN